MAADRPGPDKNRAFAQSLLVTHTFPATAGSDSAIRHDLPRARYRDVHYQVVRKDRACDVYTGDKLPEPGVLYLRSTAADAVVTLLLFIPHDALA